MAEYYRPYTTDPVNDDGEMSPFQATEQPDRQNMDSGGKGGKNKNVKEEDPLDKYSIMLGDEEGNEVVNYRETVHLMGGDIVAMRNQVRELEGINSHLRRDLASYNNAGRLMVDDHELDGLTKPEVFRRYAMIKRTLNIQKSELKSYKSKLQEGQNELIKKNEKEKDFLQMQRKFASQQMLIKNLQERFIKMKKLEEACQKQENVIQQMELILRRHHKASSSRSEKDKEAEEAHEVLQKENKRLKDQLDELRVQLQNSSSNGGDDQEKFELYQKIEKAHDKIRSLEQQLAEDARSWGKERADLDRKLNEAEHGFGRSKGMVIHDFTL
ncbi:Coiled-coil domain-containing protein 33 [Mactra antiquata]